MTTTPGAGDQLDGASNNDAQTDPHTARSRGYVLDYHKIMAKQDFPGSAGYDEWVNAAYLDQRLDRKTKELIFIVSLTVRAAAKGHIQSHIRVALDLGGHPRGDSRRSRSVSRRPESAAFQVGDPAR